MSIIDTAKEHPVAVGAVLLAAVVVVVLLLNSGGATAAQTPANGVQVGTGMQTDNQAAQFQAQLAALQIQSDAAIKSTELTTASNDYRASLAAGVASQQIEADRSGAALTSTLAASVQTKQAQTQEEISLANFNNQQQLATINAGLQTTITSTLAKATVDQAQISKDQAIESAQIYSSATIANTNAVIAGQNRNTQLQGQNAVQLQQTQQKAVHWYDPFTWFN